jgi:hypothetical protein
MFIGIEGCMLLPPVPIGPVPPVPLIGMLGIASEPASGPPAARHMQLPQTRSGKHCWTPVWPFLHSQLRVWPGVLQVGGVLQPAQTIIAAAASHAHAPCRFIRTLLPGAGDPTERLAAPVAHHSTQSTNATWVATVTGVRP